MEVISDSTIFIIVLLVVSNVWGCIGVAVHVLLDTDPPREQLPKPFDVLIVVLFWPIFVLLALAQHVQEKLDQW